MPMGKLRIGNLSPRNISSLATPNCSSNAVPVWIATIVSSQGGVTRLVRTMGEMGVGWFVMIDAAEKE